MTIAIISSQDSCVLRAHFEGYEQRKSLCCHYEHGVEAVSHTQLELPIVLDFTCSYHICGQIEISSEFSHQSFHLHSTDVIGCERLQVCRDVINKQRRSLLTPVTHTLAQPHLFLVHSSHHHNYIGATFVARNASLPSATQRSALQYKF